MQRTKQDIYALIEKGETFHLECKRAQGGLPGSLWESYSAFCNTDGGIILLGVKEEADALVVEGVADVRKPFAIAKDGISRIDETDVHESIREVLANALIHADYHGRRGIVIEKRFRRITLENPGCFRMPREEAVSGGRSDARNQIIFNIFALVEIGERSGHGLSNLFGVWKKYGYPSPTISESYDPDRTMVELKFDDVVSDREESGAELCANQRTDPKLTQNQPKTEGELAKSGPEGGQSITVGRVKSRVKSRVESRVNEDLSDSPASVRQVYAALKRDTSLTYVGIQSKLKFSTQTVAVAIATLIKRGLLRRVGPRKGGHWEIVKPHPPTGGLGS